MSDLLCKEAGYKGSSFAKAAGLITKTHIEKVYQWCKCDLACIGAGICMLSLSPFFALLAIFFALMGVIVKLESFGRTLFWRFAEQQS